MHPDRTAHYRELVFHRQHGRWAQLQGSGGFAPMKALRMLRGASTQIEAIMVVQHPIADPDTMLCEGVPQAAWRLNRFGMCEIAVNTFDPMAWPADTRWPFELVRFACDMADDRAVFLNEFTGREAGTLLRCEPVRTPDGMRLLPRKKRRYAPAAPVTKPVGRFSTESAMAFLRSDERTMTA